MAFSEILLAAVTCLASIVLSECGCTIKGSLNGIMADANTRLNVASLEDCQKICEGASGCQVFQFCNSTTACRNSYAIGSRFDWPADSPENSCRTGTGFKPQAPNDEWIAGFTVGYCGDLASVPPVRMANQNVGGTVVVLDVNSQKYYGAGTRIDTRELCAAACQDTKGCNTWVFCEAASAEGCGLGCRPAEVQNQNRTALLEDMHEHPDNLLFGDPTKFGEYSRCVCTGNSDSENCYWPKNICTLKYNSGTPEVYSSGGSWWSGTIP